MSQTAVQLEAIPLNVLIVEDSEEDADLIVLELKRGGFSPQFRRVDNGEAMRRALEEREWDLVLSDFSMPHFTMTEALAIAKERADLPFVIVSATIGEETAVEAMKAGAHDYILKHRLGRLAPAVRRELRESEVRRERRQLEDRLRRAQKLESLGLLAGGVAHDFNNLLTGILGNASLALDLTPETAVTREMLNDIIRASERAADLTRQLLAYAGKGNFVVEPVNLSSLVREISDLIRSSAPRNVTLELDLQPNVPAIEADATQMQQLVMNLILNAAEAAGERPGEVRISTGVCLIAPGEPVTQYRPDPPPPGTYVTVQVSDDGCGMTEAVQVQVFDPFFTTKFTGRGLGLSAALGIVRSHRGAISVESKEGVGSTFTVLLPAVESMQTWVAPVEEKRATEPVSAAAVLIIDDEDMVRRAARAALEHFGYSVFEASNGQDGTDLFSRLHDRISVVFLDLSMPRMDGHEVWQYIRRIRPDIGIVISSGFEEADAMKQFSRDPALFFLKKPFTAGALAEKIREAVVRK